MTDTPQPAPAKPEPAAAKPAPAKAGTAMPLTIGIVVVALAAGVAVGTLLLGPQLARSRKPAVTPASTHEAGGKESKEGKGEKPSVYRVENIIVNPSGSEGSHFLMATVAIQVDDTKLEEMLRAHDDQVRDRVIGVLEKQTIESLSAAGARDSLRGMIARALVPIIPSADPARIFLPQFVIQ
jgi:flagellar basal body-associated protein FliL